MWEHGEMTSSHLKEHWMAIKDRLWAAQSCLTKLAASEDSQRLLLQAGLQETEGRLSPESQEGERGLDSTLNNKREFRSVF